LPDSLCMVFSFVILALGMEMIYNSFAGKF